MSDIRPLEAGARSGLSANDPVTAILLLRDIQPMAQLLLTAPGPRPPYYRVARHLWGQNADFDSDGDSTSPDATDWTELTLALRDDGGVSSDSERVDIDPVGAEPLVLAVVSESSELARKTAEFLRSECGGELTT